MATASVEGPADVPGAWHRLKTVLVFAVVLWCLALPCIAQGAPNNVAATLVFLRADYAFAQSIRTDIAVDERSANSFAAEVTAECSNVLVNAPHTGGFNELSSEATLGILDAFARPSVRAGLAFAGHVARLRWTSRSLTTLVYSRAAEDRAEANIPPPHLCADLNAWVASDYRTVPHDTVAFIRSYLSAREGTEASDEGILRKLTSYEGPRMRMLAAKVKRLEAQISPLLRAAIKIPLSRLTKALGVAPGTL